MQGNCKGPVPGDLRARLRGAPLQGMRKGQCLVVAHSHLLLLSAPNVWVDSLFLRWVPAASAQVPAMCRATTAFHSQPARRTMVASYRPTSEPASVTEYLCSRA
jgi:hypothetical protein